MPIPTSCPGAVEEVLRWVTPLNNFFRRAAGDDRIGDQPVERGDRIILLYPSANRDEAVFADPFTFDIRRDPNPHVAFGFGTHLCIGTHVARASLAAVFGQLSHRVTDLRVVEEPVVEANIFARAVAVVPARLQSLSDRLEPHFPEGDYLAGAMGNITSLAGVIRVHGRGAG